MHAGTMSSLKGRLNNSAVGPRFGSTKIAAAVIRGFLTMVVPSVLLLIASHAALAQTETVLYNFCSQGGDLCTDGDGPEANLTSYNGNLYGTTPYGGAYNGG